MRATFQLLVSITAVVGVAVLANAGRLPAPSDEVKDESGHAGVQTVNRIIGDAGYVARFGEPPSAIADEDVRIVSHLTFVEERLRERAHPSLTPGQQRLRRKALDHLRAYRSAGTFPRNTHRTGERTPVFIDEHGRICAVGYLIEQTAGRDAAEQINERYRYSYVDDMELPWLHQWAVMHGLSVRELAMIQPKYSPPPGEEEKMDGKIEVASIGLNVSSTLVNAWMMSRQRSSALAAGAGLVAGGAGLAIGLSDRARYPTPDLVAAGASVLISGWTLFRRANPSVQRSAHRPEINPVLLPAENGSRLGLRARWEL